MRTSRQIKDELFRLTVFVVVVSASLFLSACGGGDDDGGGGNTEVEYFAPGGVSEQMLREKPNARLNLDHTVVVTLEATGTHDGDSGQDEGTDEFCYHFDVPTQIRLSLDEFEEAPTLIALDELKNEIARVDGESGEVEITFEGEHWLRFVHPRAGDPTAEPLVFFIRPGRPEELPGAALVGGGVGSNPTDVATLKAGKDCVRCDLSNLVWSACPGIVFKGINLSHANFNSASLVCITFGPDSKNTPSMLIGANLENFIIGQSFFTGTDLTDANFHNASFGVTVLDDVTATNTDFSGAQFANSTFGASKGTGSSARGANFTNAVIHFNTCFSVYDLRDADFTGAAFDSESSVHGTWFSGANLFDTTFDGTKFQYDSSLPNCGGNQGCTSVTVDGLCTDCPCTANLGCLDLGGETYCPSNQGPVTLSEPAVCQRPTVQADPDGVLFQGMDLRDIDFNGADLTNAIFASTMLDATNYFDGAVLAGVDFTQQDLSQSVDLSGAYLSQATNFAGAVLSDTPNERGVNLSCDPVEQTGGCDFPAETTQFMGVNMNYTKLNHAGLSEAELDKTTFQHAEMIGADLTFASLADADFTSALLGTAPGSGGAANLRSAYMINAILSDADMRSVDLTDAHIYGTAVFKCTLLDSADLSGAILAGATFTDASFTAANFNGAQLASATFDGATLTNAKFDDAYLQGVDFSTAASVTGMSLSNAAVSTDLMSENCTLEPPGSWTYMEQDGTTYTFKYGVTKLQTDSTVICPDNRFGPCDSGDSLCPVDSGPFPPIPDCTPVMDYCWENCGDPPCFLDTPPCPFTSNCS